MADDEKFDDDVNRAVRDRRVWNTATRRLAEEAAGEVQIPEFVQLDDMLAMPDEPVLHRIDDNLPIGGNALLAAQQKAGKTTLVGNTIRALVDDELFLDRYKVEPVTRLVLFDNELDSRMTRRWLRDQGIQNTSRVTVVCMKGRLGTFNILDDAVRANWVARLQDLAPQMAIFDPLRPALDALGLSEDKDAGRFLQAWDALKVEAGISETIVVHHMGHTGDRARGDSRLIDWADANWKIRKESQKRVDDDPFTPLDDGGQRFYTAHGRDVYVPEGLLTYDAAAGRRMAYMPRASGQGIEAAAIRKLITDYVEGQAGTPVSRNKVVTHLMSTNQAPRDPARDVFDAMYAEAVANSEGLPFRAFEGPKKAQQLIWGEQ